MKKTILVYFLLIGLSSADKNKNFNFNENITFTLAQLSESRNFIGELLKDKSHMILTKGVEYDLSSNIIRKMCFYNNIKACPDLVLLKKDSVTSPFSILGTIFISKGTVAKLNEEGYLPFILGHELSHIVFGHKLDFDGEIIKNPPSSIISNEILLLVLDEPFRQSREEGYDKDKEWLIELLKIPTAIMYTLIYSQLMEYQADIGSIKLMRKSNYPLNPAIFFWSNVRSIFGDYKEFNSAHPDYGKRKATLIEYIYLNQ